MSQIMKSTQISTLSGVLPEPGKIGAPNFGHDATYIRLLRLSVTLEILVAVAASLLAYKLLIYPFFFAPLRHVPGPYITKVTQYWWTLQGYCNNGNQWIEQQHLKYGPVVQIGPDNVSFNSVDAIAEIYGVRSNFPKQECASNMDNYGEPNVFSSASNQDHRRRRNRYAAVYSKTNMATGDGYEAILKSTRQVLRKIEHATNNAKPVDIYQLFHFYGIDCVAVIATGTSPRLLEGHNVALSTHLRDVFSGLGYIYYFEAIRNLRKLLPMIADLFITEQIFITMSAHEEVRKFNLEHFYSSLNAKPEFGKSVLKRLKEHKDYGTPDLTEMAVASELSDHLLAGADTLVAGMAYTFWELAKSENIVYQTALRDELGTVTFTAEGLPSSFTAIDSLPWIENCLKEGMRLHTPSGNIQARRVPPGGASVMGYFLPNDTEVGIPFWAMSHNSNIYKEAYKFDPRRWFPESGTDDELYAMKQAWPVFGHGSRVCVGKELAWVQAKLLLATIFRKWTVKLDDAQDPSAMEHVQSVVLAPKGGCCSLVFSEPQMDCSA